MFPKIIGAGLRDTARNADFLTFAAKIPSRAVNGCHTLARTQCAASDPTTKNGNLWVEGTRMRLEGVPNFVLRAPNQGYFLEIHMFQVRCSIV